MTGFPAAILLDRCAAIWLASGETISAYSRECILAAGTVEGIYISPVTAWEIGMLSRPRPGQRKPLQFLPDPKAWYGRLISGPGIRQANLTADIAIESSRLPGNPPTDPGDRLIIATARQLNIPVTTRDRRIIGYGKAGHVQVVAR